jgi:hypothetical protein
MINKLKTFLIFLITLTFAISLYGNENSPQNTDFESRVKHFLGKDKDIYNIYIWPEGYSQKILSRQLIQGDSYNYFGLGLEYQPDPLKIRVYKYFFDGHFQLRAIQSPKFNISPNTPIILIKGCQLLILTMLGENGEEILVLNSDLEQENPPNANPEIKKYLQDFYKKIQRDSTFKFANKTLKIQTNGWDYSIPINRLVDENKYKFTTDGKCELNSVKGN